jgi:hypothetical protein
MDFNLYRTYFKHQAQNHPLLLHTSSNRVFAVVRSDAAYGDLRSKVKEKDFVFRLLEYTYQRDDNESPARKRIRGGFMVAKFYSQRNGDDDTYFSAIEAAEAVMDDLIDKMISDSENGHPLFGYDFELSNELTITPVHNVGDGSYAGWEVLFTLRPGWPERCGTVAWLDNGTTPFTLLDDIGAYLIDDTGAVLSTV